ncbi:hypothetical protein [Hymenobacter yonginensis]|uniref:Hemagglutinin n=1 Tax=Hymenobacter yonginensis TaxID=748197 RepID=A0ABY7PNU0_9BACT|nr:hypothetical protein [Hymenobacter yonginensis]WBO84739.1 hypothetical protein O9Z63_00510 [Hymenobacter yonginensis]
MLTAKQDNRLTAAQNTLLALRQDPTPYQQDKALQNTLAELQQLTDDLGPLRQQTQRASKGKTAAKTDRREQLATSASEIAGDLYAYATAQQDPGLQASANHSYGTLLNLRANALTDAAQHLLDYGVSPERLAELRDTLAAFSTSKNDPRQQISEAKAARLAIKDKFSQLATLLEDRLDRSLRKYARSAPEFYQRIQAARLIIDRPGKRTGDNDQTLEKLG